MSQKKQQQEKQEHWEGVYTSKATDNVSWYEPRPEMSLNLIERYAASHDAHIVDVGAGASLLVDNLLDKGFEHITVLDISQAALEASKQRLGESKASSVQWVCANILDAQFNSSFDIWHDRAVFHFLTQPEDQQQYIDVMRKSLVANATVIVATFSLDGPEKCSGLPVQRYSAETLTDTLGDEFELLESHHTVHETPWESQQNFVYAVFKYLGG